jgi:hypothetical protein
VIDTTVNIHGALEAKLARLSYLHACSRSRIMLMVVERFLQKKRLRCKLYQRVKYQERDEECCWDIVHFYMPAVIYEKCCDVRKFYKLSVSLFIAMACDLYLDEIENEKVKTPKPRHVSDNYWDEYTCTYSEKEKSINFHISWRISIADK